MSIENPHTATDDELLESAQQIAEELERRGLRLSHSLGEHAVDSVEYERAREVDPFLVPGSEEAKEYARERGVSGLPRWMERLSKVDMFGRPTVFSDRFDPSDRGL